MLKSEFRADLYREKASHAIWIAKTCGLPQVRDKHEHAASAWLELARREDQRSVVARRLAAGAPVKRTAPPRPQLARLASA